MKKRFLLGATKYKELVFGNFEITTRNKYPEFTASFDTVKPFKGDEIDLIRYYEDWCDGMDKTYLYDLYERYHCSPQELPKELADECYDVRDAMDCSLYPEIIEVDGVNWYFESGSCGQHDTRKDGMEEYTNKNAYDILHAIWDEYHLSDIRKHGGEANIRECIEDITKILSEIDEKEWIKDYIRRN